MGRLRRHRCRSRSLCCSRPRCRSRSGRSEVPPSWSWSRAASCGCSACRTTTSGGAVGPWPGCGANRGWGRMLRTPSLRELELVNCKLRSDDVSLLAAALPRSGLQRLELAKNALASNELAALASHLEASKVEDLGLESNELGRGSALSALEHAYSKRPIANLRLEGNRLSQRELADLMASLKRLRSKSGIDFSMASCRAGCDCNGRGEVM
mmetsp:Transcript_47432/g.151244  ORF Transcript_47432/g.151244 Transcript_47432/m.151244 type:complete len:211 (-) Transcript_47432:54-686(-)